ncbi:hypothetical protein ACE6H2_013316 [Prunus campanulata]
MRPCDKNSQSLGAPSHGRGRDGRHHQPSSKISKISAPGKPISKLVTSKINLDDLPEFVLLEILCRLPSEFAVQCMCVSKRWFSLIYSSYFFRRVQSDKPITRTVIVPDIQHARTTFFSVSSEEPPHELVFKTPPREFSLSFLPCFRADCDFFKGEPCVVGTYNDLILCCATTHYQRDYYICNPRTKQWEALPCPPRRGRHKRVMVGFICDPNYKYKNDRKQVEAERSRRTVNIQLNYSIINVEYRYKVVRIIDDQWERPEHSSRFFYMEIFSSETGKWRQSLVFSPRRFCFTRLSPYPGVAHNGSLYWFTDTNRFMVGLDPFTTRDQLYINDTSNYCFRFIDEPEEESRTMHFLGECGGGCLRMCMLPHYCDLSGMSVWEFKDDGRGYVDGQVDGPGKWCLVDKVCLFQLVPENPLLTKWDRESSTKTVMVLAFDPNNKDVLFLHLFGRIVMYNMRAKTLKETTWTTPFTTLKLRWAGVSVFPAFPFLLPWWPTPIITSRGRRQRFSSNRLIPHTAKVQHHTPVSSKRPKENGRKEAVATAASSSRRPSKRSRR